MSESDLLISCKNVSKKFCKDLKRSLRYGAQDVLTDLFGIGKSTQNVLRPEEFFAVKELSFELKRGDCLGIIGRNGAGKTTILKLLTGLIKPEHGQINIRGRIGALIAVGAGFNPVLTGRENVYANGAILGLTKREINDRFDEILDFSGIEEFIDTPVRSYSSGMQVRLGMAVAAHINPDILLLDEILAVGDLNFQRKCLKVVSAQMAGGNHSGGPSGTVLVSHNMEAITKYCSRAMVVERGEVVFDGTPSDGIKAYFDLNKEKLNVDSQNTSDRLARCSLDAEFTSFRSVDQEGNERWEVSAFEPINFEFTFKINRKVEDLCLHLQLRDSLTDKTLTSAVVIISAASIEIGEVQTCRCTIESGTIRPGMYFIYAVLSNRSNSKPFDVLDQNVDLPALLISSEGVSVNEMIGYFNMKASLRRIA